MLRYNLDNIEGINHNQPQNMHSYNPGNN